MGSTLFNILQLGAYNNENGKNLSINKMLNCLSPTIKFKLLICIKGHYMQCFTQQGTEFQILPVLNSLELQGKISIMVRSLNGSHTGFKASQCMYWKTSLLTLKKMSALYQAPPKLVTVTKSSLINANLIRSTKANDIALTKFFEALHGSQFMNNISKF